MLAYWCNRFPEDGWAVHTLSPHGGVVHCARDSFADAPPTDVLIHPADGAR